MATKTATRTAAIWMSLVLILGLVAGCSSASQPSDSSNTGTTAQDSAECPQANALIDTSQFKKSGPYKVHWASYWTGHPWMADMQRHLEVEFAKHKDVTFTVSDGQNKKEKLIADIEDAIARQPDLLIITSGDADSPRDAVARAVQDGIPVLSLQKVLNGCEVTAKVLADDVDIAREQAKSLVKALEEKFGGPKGNVAIMAGIPGASNTNDRYAGFKEILSKYPDIKIVADQTALFRRDKGRELMENWIQSDTQIDGVLTMADEMAIGAALAIRDAKKADDYIVIAANAQTEALQMIKAGEIYSSYWVPAAVPEGVEVAMKILQGEQIPFTTVVQGEMIDQSNVDQVLNPDCFKYWGPKYGQGC